MALAVFAPINASAQVNIYVGPGGYAHYGYGYGYPHYGYGYPHYGYGYGHYPSYGYGMATILPTATAITADILATTVAIGAMDVG